MYTSNVFILWFLFKISLEKLLKITPIILYYLLTMYIVVIATMFPFKKKRVDNVTRYVYIEKLEIRSA